MFSFVRHHCVLGKMGKAGKLGILGRSTFLLGICISHFACSDHSTPEFNSKTAFEPSSVEKPLLQANAKVGDAVPVVRSKFDPAKSDCAGRLAELRAAFSGASTGANADSGFRGLCVVGTVVLEAQSITRPVEGALVQLFEKPEFKATTDTNGMFTMLLYSVKETQQSSDSSLAQSHESIAEFRLSSAEYDARWYLFISSKSKSSRASYDFALTLPDFIPSAANAEVFTLKDLKLKPVSKIYGTVSDAEGKPKAGVKVSIADSPWTTTSDSEGRYVLKGLPAGAVTVQADKGVSEKTSGESAEEKQPAAEKTVILGAAAPSKVDVQISAPPELGQRQGQGQEGQLSESQEDGEASSWAGQVNGSGSVPALFSVTQNVGTEQAEIHAAGGKVFIPTGSFKSPVNLRFASIEPESLPTSLAADGATSFYSVTPGEIETDMPLLLTLKCREEGKVYSIRLHSKDTSNPDSLNERVLGSQPCINGVVQFSSHSTGVFSLKPVEQSVAAEVGIMGKVLSLNNATVQISIPPGALFEPESIAMTLLPNSEETTLKDRVSPVVVLKPHGTIFEEPVTAQLPCDAAQEGNNVTVMWKTSDLPDTRWWSHSNSVCKAGKVEFRTSHFSVYSAIQNAHAASNPNPLVAPPSPTDLQREAIPEHKKVADAVTVVSALVRQTEKFGNEGANLVKALISEGIKVYLSIDTDVTFTQNQAWQKELGATKENLRLLNAPEKEAVVWARDFVPQLVRKNGQFGYMHNGYHYYDGQSSNTGKALATAQIRNGFSGELSLKSFEGGNFMVNSNRECIVSTRLIAANTEAFVRSELGLKMDCRSLLIVPGLPFEPTQHVDLFLKFLTDDTILVGDFNPAHLAKLKPFLVAQVIALGKSAKQAEGYARRKMERFETQKKYLDDLALALQNGDYSSIPPPQYERANTKMAGSNPNLKFNVVRIQNPILMPAKFMSHENYDTSYTNSLFVHSFVNNKVTFHAFVPEYKTYWFREHGRGEPSWQSDAELQSLNGNARAIFESFGFKATMIPFDRVSSYMGSVHCTTRESKWDCPSGFVWNEVLNKCRAAVTSPSITPPPCLPTVYHDVTGITTFMSMDLCLR